MREPDAVSIYGWYLTCLAVLIVLSCVFFYGLRDDLRRWAAQAFVTHQQQCVTHQQLEEAIAAKLPPIRPVQAPRPRPERRKFTTPRWWKKP